MRPFIPILLASAGLAFHAVPVAADHPTHPRVEVTSGRFETLPGGADQGLDVRGGAIMFRTDRHGGRTMVVVRARGLRADTTYPAHVHNRPCSASPPGGSHYQHVIDGPVDDVNEMWPAITTDAHGRGAGFAVHGARARDDARSIVVHEPTNTSIRVACLDLS
jgi:hypothetical protein